MFARPLRETMIMDNYFLIMPIYRPKDKEKAGWYIGFVLVGMLLGPAIFPPNEDNGLLMSLIIGSTLGTLPIGLIEFGLLVNNVDERGRMKDELLQDEYYRMEAKKRLDKERK